MLTQVPEAVSTIGVVVLASQVRQNLGSVEHLVQFVAVQVELVTQAVPLLVAYWPQPGAEVGMQYPFSKRLGVTQLTQLLALSA